MVMDQPIFTHLALQMFFGFSFLLFNLEEKGVSKVGKEEEEEVRSCTFLSLLNLLFSTFFLFPKA